MIIAAPWHPAAPWTGQNAVGVAVVSSVVGGVWYAAKWLDRRSKRRNEDAKSDERNPDE
jgi:hypothetical protein